MAKNAVENAIKNVATKKLNGVYNLQSYREGGKNYPKRQAAELHKDICEKVVAFMEAHPEIPLYQVLAVGIAKGAYKMSAFEKGYTKFDGEKVLAVAEYVKAYVAYHACGKKGSDVTWRLCTNYYENVSKDITDFNAALAATEPNKDSGKRGNYETLCGSLAIPKREKKEKPAKPSADDALAALMGDFKEEEQAA